MQIALTEPQERFVFSEAQFPAMCAGLGSGKTEAAIVRLLIKMLEEPGINTGYYMPTYDLIRLRAMPGAEETISRIGLPITSQKTNFTITIHGHGDMVFRSYERPERIVSYEVAHSITDELDTLQKDKAAFVWRKVSERNRQKCKGKNTIGNVTTPDQGFSGFTYERWGGDSLPAGHELIKAATSSNPFLPDGYIEQIRSNYDPILAEMYLNGDFVSLTQNKVYHFFNRTTHHTSRTITSEDKLLHIGLDFNIGGTCAVVFLIENNNPVAVDEFVSHDTRDFINNLARYNGKTCIIYPDASGNANRTNASQSDIQLIRSAKYQVLCKESNPAIRDRINAFNGLLAHGRLSVNTNKCPKLTNALETQGYDKKGEPEKFDTHPALDDWCFSGDTEIIVNDKRISFKDVPKTGFVRNAFGENVIFFNGGLKGRGKLFDVKLINGTIIRSTGDHMFLTLNGWIEAEHLTGETLCNTQYCQTAFKNSMAENIIKERTGIFTKHLEHARHYIKVLLGRVYTEKFGNTLTDQYQKVLSFIILMKIKIIITLRTWLLCREVNITPCTSLNGIRETLIIQERQLINLKINVERGTNQIEGMNGISSIMKTIKNCFIKLLKVRARFAGKHIKEHLQERTNSVQENAMLNREEIAELIMKSESVFNAKNSSQLISTHQRNTVVESVQQIGDIVPVYCLSTNEGSFSLADGIVVSNCDSAGYMVAYKYPVIGSFTQVKLGGMI